MIYRNNVLAISQRNSIKIDYFPNGLETKSTGEGKPVKVNMRRLFNSKLKFADDFSLPAPLDLDKFQHTPSITMKFGEKKSLQFFITWWNQFIIEEFSLADDKAPTREKTIEIDNTRRFIASSCVFDTDMLESINANTKYFMRLVIDFKSEQD